MPVSMPAAFFPEAVFPAGIFSLQNPGCRFNPLCRTKAFSMARRAASIFFSGH